MKARNFAIISQTFLYKFGNFSEKKFTLSSLYLQKINSLLTPLITESSTYMAESNQILDRNVNSAYLCCTLSASQQTTLALTCQQVILTHSERNIYASGQIMHSQGSDLIRHLIG